MPVVEGGDQLDVLRQQHAVAKHIATHIADPDNGEILRLGVDPYFQEVPLDTFPGAPRGDAHRLVVVPDGAAGCERVAEPESVGQRDIVGDVGEGGGAFIGRHHEIRVVPVAAPHPFGRHHRVGGAIAVIGDVE
ncbi:Uncharacterised protein [Mycobacteroides abscessus subsp. abscessus]|nr:Uncharacterised protein [Mycobacteroides abscessus subsp. abscessus]